MKYLFVLIFIFLVGKSILLSGTNYKTEYLTPADGLPQTFVYCTYQDSRGFLWIGTRNGLARYDGYEFRTYQHDPFDSNTLSGNNISAILEDSKGNLWIGTQNSGLNYLDRKSGRITRFRHDQDNPNSLSSDLILSLTITDDDELWISTKTGGLNHSQPGKNDFNIPYTYVNDIKKDILEKISPGLICMDKDDDFYLLMGGKKYLHIIKFFSDSKEFRVFKKIDRSKIFNINIFGTDVRDNDYIHYQYKNGNKEVVIINGSDGSVLRTIEYDERLTKKYQYIVMQLDKNKNLWMYVFDSGKIGYRPSEDNSGLYRLGDIRDLNKITPVNKVIGLNYWRIPSPGNVLTEDNKGIIWAGSSKGLAKLIPISPGLTNYNHKPLENSISNNFIRSIFVDDAGNIYIGTDNGLNILKKGESQWENIYAKEYMGLGYNSINAFYEEDDGTILIGTNRGVNIYDPKSGIMVKSNSKMLRMNAAMSRQSIWSFYRDKQQNLWIGIMNGIYIFDKDNKLIKYINTIKKKQGLSKINGIWFIYEDRRGNVWAGTSEGLFRWLPGEKKFKRYIHITNDTNSICGNHIWSIAEDLNGNLWVGAYGAGLSKYDYKNDSFSSITLKDGLPDNGIASILCDDSNNLWIGTGKGLVKYNQEKKSFRIYNADDGFANNEYSFHAYFKCKDGSMLMGGLNGFSRFYPDSLVLNKLIPQIAITSFKIHAKEIYPELCDGDTVNVDWEDKYFSFEYAVLDYRSPKQNKYAYKLENHDDEWVYTGTRRIAAFSYIEPGEYVFKVKGSNSHGVWNEKGISIYVNVIPPFWMTSWFRILIVLLIGVSITFLIIARIRRRRRKERTKRRILVSQLKALQSQMNPHFIFNSLNSIMNLILKRENEQSMQYLTKFSRLLRNILENSRSLSTSLSQEIEYLTIYLELESLRFENKFDYQITFDNNINPEQMSVPTLLIQPYIENSIRHGKVHSVENGKVEINFSLSDGYLICDIIDNGIGRQKSKEIKSKATYLHKSFGMAVNKERLGLLDSGVDVIDLFDDNGRPAGTHVKLMLNLKADLIDDEEEY